MKKSEWIELSLAIRSRTFSRQWCFVKWVIQGCATIVAVVLILQIAQCNGVVVTNTDVMVVCYYLYSMIGCCSWTKLETHNAGHATPINPGVATWFVLTTLNTGGVIFYSCVEMAGSYGSILCWLTSWWGWGSCLWFFISRQHPANIGPARLEKP